MIDVISRDLFIVFVTRQDPLLNLKLDANIVPNIKKD